MKYYKKSFTLVSLFLLVILITKPISLLAYPIDPTFNTGTGFDGGEVYAVAQQSDGKLIVVGDFTAYNGVPANRIIRLNTDGTVDNTFITGGLTGGLDSWAWDVSIQTISGEEKIFITGNFTDYNGNAVQKVARINSNGTFDTSFTLDPAAQFGQYALGHYIQTDGKIVIVGSDNLSIGKQVRVNDDGTLDPSFQISIGDIDETVYNIARSSLDSSFIMTGQFTMYLGATNSRIAKIGDDGTVDSKFSSGTGFDGTTLPITIDNSGRILIGGSFSNYNREMANNIVRLIDDGAIDMDFNRNIGNGFNGTVRTINILNDGDILVTGAFTEFNGTPSPGIIRLNSDGTPDNEFSPGVGFDSYTRDTLVQTDGNIVIVGAFTSYDGTPAGEIVRLAAGSSGPPSVPATPTITSATDTGPSASDAVTYDTTPDFTGSCVDGNTMTIYIDSIAISPTTLCSGGVYTITPGTPLAIGQYDVRVTATNGFGESLQSSVLILSIYENQTTFCRITGTNPHPLGPMAISAPNNKMYVAQYTTSTVSKINLTNNTLASTITSPQNTYGTRIFNNKLYIINNRGASLTGSVTIINPATDAIIQTITVGNDPTNIQEFGNELYVHNRQGNTITVINKNTDTVVTTITGLNNPTQSTFANGKIYVNNHGGSTVWVVDPVSHAITATISVGVNPVESILVGTKLYVANWTSANISVINTSNNAVLSTISTTGDGVGGTAALGNYVYFRSRNTNDVFVVDKNSDTLVKTIKTPSGGYYLNVFNGKIYVNNQSILSTDSSYITIIDATTNEVIKDIQVGTEPHSMTVYNNKMYIPNFVSNDISIIDLTTDRLLDDCNPPAAPSTAPDMTAVTDTGSSNTDNITTDTTPDFTGACTNGQTVKLYVDSIAVTPTQVCSGGTYNITLSSPLAIGTHTITSTFTNPVGESGQSPVLSFQIVAPTIINPNNGGGGVILIPSPIIPSRPISSILSPLNYTSPLDDKKYECKAFVSYMRFGLKNDKDQVKLLQAFLNKFANENLIVDGIFDSKTTGAVKRFQALHSEVVLKPWNIKVPTGFFYKTTKAMANSILGCGEGEIQLDNGVNINVQ